MPREDGAIIVDGVQVHSTYQCSHCNAHFVVVKGSGRQRGYCLGCDHVTCGKPECNEHFPFEKKLDLWEKGLLKRG